MGFKEFVVSYGKFHDNLINKLIHIIFIPTIVVWIMGTMHYYPIADFGYGYEKIDIAFIILGLIMPPIYIYLEVVSGLTTTILFHTAYYYSLQMWKQHKDDTDFFMGVSFMADCGSNSGTSSGTTSGSVTGSTQMSSLQWVNFVLSKIALDFPHLL